MSDETWHETPIYCITGFSPVPGDAWYVEADSARAAIDIVSAELKSDPDFDPSPVETWEVNAVPRPFTLMLLKD